MKDNLQQLVTQIKSLPASDFQKLLDILLREDHSAPQSIEDFVSELKSAQVYTCPYCGSTHIVRNGHRPDGVQKFRCKDCHRSFVPMTNTIFANTHKPLTAWQDYIKCVMSKETVKDSAASCGLTVKTSFFWRHKILSGLLGMEENVVIDGISEGDETYFTLSFKGNAKSFKEGVPNRKQHKRGGEVHTRGLSKELVCVPCVVSRDHRSIAHPACLGGCSFEALNNVLGGKVQKGSYLCTDANSIYCKFAKENELNLVQIKGGKETRGTFHIQHLNSYHSMLKKFIEKFNGVATKYLDGYLAWHNFLNYAKEGIADKARILKEWMVKCGKNFTHESIFTMPSLPFACR